ncbi:MAG: bifunctional enoyl-CoA hydratase/phosphate acetyltransferase [Christensenellales bacterium]
MQMITSFAQLLKSVQQAPNKRIAVAAADELEVLEVIRQAEEMDLADFILIGDRERMDTLIRQHGMMLKAEIVHEPDHRKAAEKAVQMVRQGEADTLMKGMLHSAIFLKAVLNKETGLNTGKYITQISVIEKDDGGLLMITDCAITVNPDLKGKVQVLENAVELAHSLGIALPKVALLAPLETVNPDIQDTVDAAIISKMGQRGQIKGCLIDGPLAFDNAVSQEAADAKGIKSEVAGKADIIVVPNLSVGNAITKTITYIAKKPVIAATVGAAVPLVFTSRTESDQGKLLTIALAAYASGEAKA